MPQIPDRLQTGMSFEDSIPQLNQMMDSIDNENRTKIIRNGNIPSLLMGYQKGGFTNGDYGFKVSKINTATNAPYDVTTATASQLAFTSDQNVFKIVKSGTATVTLPAGYTPGALYQTTIPHGLSYMPAHMAFMNQVGSTGVYLQPVPFTSTAWDAPSVSYQTWAMGDFGVDATNMYFQVFANGSAFYNGNWIFKYYLLQETAN